MSKPSGEPSFEGALAELEKIVARMEGGELSLEEALAVHRRGLELARFCQQKLEAAQQQVKVLEGEVLKPLATPPSSRGPMKIIESDFQAWMGDIQARTEAALARLLPPAHMAPARLHEAMRYATLEGGKRVRPLLAFAAGEVAAASPERLEMASCAVELIHAYSLVHDDLPCMDNDVLRRGKPTVHVEYDEATALLVGDALQSLAFQLLSDQRLADDARVQLDMVRTLALAAGSRGMAGGQQIDLESTGKTLTL